METSGFPRCVTACRLLLEMLPAVRRKVACFEMDSNHFKIQCVYVSLEISVNTRSFKNCSTQHIQFVSTQTTKSEISLAMEQNAKRNFARWHESLLIWEQ